MPRVCTVCKHEDRETIDQALIERKAGFRHIASRFGVGYRSLCRHYENHIPENLSQSQKSQEIVRGDNLVEEVMTWRKEIEEIFHEAKAEKSIGLALQAIDRAYRLIELQGKLIGMLNEDKALHINITQITAEVSSFLKEKFPDAFVAYREYLTEKYDAHRN
jgi:hypothetical protein